MVQKKVLVLGYDCATLDLIIPWAKEGKLPNFKKIIDSGVYGEMKSTIQPITAAAWTSFATGMNPGKHGIYDYSYRNETTYDINIINSGNPDKNKIWDHLAKNGLKTGLINLPMTYPPRKIDGFMVTSILTPSIESEFTYPKELKKEILSIWPDYSFADSHFTPEDEKSIREFIDKSMKEIDKRKEVIFNLMDNKEWNLLITVFMELDTIQHKFWKYMDKTYPGYNKEKADKFGTTIYDFYKKLDDVLGEFIEKIGNDITLIIVGDHGSGPALKTFYINNWLKEKGFITVKKDIKSSLFSFLNNKGLNLSNMYKIIQKLKLKKLVHIFPRNTRNNLLRTFTLSFSDVNWSKTKAYSFGYFGRIFINLKDREPNGCVSEEEYEKVREEIINELYKIIDPETNEKIVDKVWRREELYKGKYFDKSADIIFRMKNYSYNTSLHFEFASNKIFDKNLVNRSGDHRMNGTFLAYGPNIKKGYEIKGLEIIDCTPTLLSIFDVPIPKEIDGKVAEEIFIEKPKIRYSESKKSEENTINNALKNINIKI